MNPIFSFLSRISANSASPSSNPQSSETFEKVPEINQIRNQVLAYPETNLTPSTPIAALRKRSASEIDSEEESLTHLPKRSLLIEPPPDPMDIEETHLDKEKEPKFSGKEVASLLYDCVVQKVSLSISLEELFRDRIHFTSEECWDILYLLTRCQLGISSDLRQDLAFRAKTLSAEMQNFRQVDLLYKIHHNSPYNETPPPGKVICYYFTKNWANLSQDQRLEFGGSIIKQFYREFSPEEACAILRYKSFLDCCLSIHPSSVEIVLHLFQLLEGLPASDQLTRAYWGAYHFDRIITEEFVESPEVEHLTCEARNLLASHLIHEHKGKAPLSVAQFIEWCGTICRQQPFPTALPGTEEAFSELIAQFNSDDNRSKIRVLNGIGWLSFCGRLPQLSPEAQSVRLKLAEEVGINSNDPYYLGFRIEFINKASTLEYAAKVLSQMLEFNLQLDDSALDKTFETCLEKLNRYMTLFPISHGHCIDSIFQSLSTVPRKLKKYNYTFSFEAQQQFEILLSNLDKYVQKTHPPYESLKVFCDFMDIPGFSGIVNRCSKSVIALVLKERERDRYPFDFYQNEWCFRFIRTVSETLSRKIREEIFQSIRTKSIDGFVSLLENLETKGLVSDNSDQARSQAAASIAFYLKRESSSLDDLISLLILEYSRDENPPYFREFCWSFIQLSERMGPFTLTRQAQEKLWKTLDKEIEQIQNDSQSPFSHHLSFYCLALIERLRELGYVGDVSPKTTQILLDNIREKGSNILADSDSEEDNCQIQALTFGKSLLRMARCKNLEQELVQTVLTGLRNLWSIDASAITDIFSALATLHLKGQFQQLTPEEENGLFGELFKTDPASYTKKQRDQLFLNMLSLVEGQAIKRPQALKELQKFFKEETYSNYYKNIYTNIRSIRFKNRSKHNR